MRKASPYILLLVLALAVIVIKKYRDDRQPERKSKYRDPSSDTNRKKGFDRRITYIEYTAHAKCRMQCRKISRPEVEEIMQQGEINYCKTDIYDRPCPSYTLEGITQDNQRVRIVFAQCDLKTKVVTVIDLDTEWDCDCPGDEGKY